MYNYVRHVQRVVAWSCSRSYVCLSVFTSWHCWRAQSQLYIQAKLCYLQ